MTVAEIKKFIDNLISECENELGENPYIVNNIIIQKMNKFEDIKEMLDQLDEWVSVDDRLPTKEDILFEDEPYFAITYKNKWNEIKTTYCNFDFEKKKFKIYGVDVLAWKTFGEPYKESK